MYEWDDKYSVNIPEMDYQHKEWLHTINRLLQAMKERKTKALMNNILMDIKEFSNFHFSSEERYMKQINYIGYEEQKKLHNDFRKLLDDYEKKFNENNFSISIELLNTLKSWLINHIMKEDLKYSDVPIKL